jgi:hypothetical protein
LGATETLLNRLSVELSTNPDDVAANDALLQRELSELPKSVANILLLSPDGRNIGNAVGNHASAGDRDYFKRASAGDQLVVEAPIRSRSNLGWVIPIARRISDRGGSTRAVLVAAISVDSIRDLINLDELPVGSLVRVVTEDEIQIAFSSEGSELLTLNGKVVRVIGFSRTQRVPWLVTVGLPVKVVSEAAAER